MSDEFRGMDRDEVACDALLSTQDENDWRAARGYEPLVRHTTQEMVAYFAAERAEVERSYLEDIAERAVIAEWWRARERLKRRAS